MKIFVFLFPQFNFSAPKEEAYFKMLSEDELLACRMKETHLRYSFCFSTLFSYYHRKHWGGGCCLAYSPSGAFVHSFSKCIELKFG